MYLFINVTLVFRWKKAGDIIRKLCPINPILEPYELTNTNRAQVIWPRIIILMYICAQSTFSSNKINVECQDFLFIIVTRFFIQFALTYKNAVTRNFSSWNCDELYKFIYTVVERYKFLLSKKKQEYKFGWSIM